MSDEYELTGLWQRSLGVPPEPAYQKHWQQLCAAYTTLRDRARQLTARIHAELPELTVHDITHLDALWETADLIAGPDYPLNPLEGFVLGGAIMLHDAALCFEAYENGRDGVRATPEWRDAYAAEKLTKAAEDGVAGEHNADFTALRVLHSSQAVSLATRSWGVAGSPALHLIDNLELRESYGALVGLIAASHHWNIEKVYSDLPEQINAIGTFRREWRVDPVKIACLLRCADAAHIDKRRAPDFVYALARRSGLSGDHWKAQNWLGRIDIDHSDPSHTSLVVTSNHNFQAADAGAWWVAFDAISLAHRELVACNELLASRAQKGSSPPFRAKRISGTLSPHEMTKYVRVSGWKPTSASIHVSNVERLISSLGGPQLYGKTDHFLVVLRELIQNARDAVAARRFFDADLKGRIRIRVNRSAEGQTSIEVDDNGIGMSERVLTGPLLDFGTSFWSSSLVQAEYPGLKSSAFRSVGRYGIGFYSIFMISSSVVVSSRRWNESIDDVRSLHFGSGLSMRPTLITGRPSAFDVDLSTRVTCVLEDSLPYPARITIKPAYIGKADFSVPMRDFLARLVAGIDVKVEFKDGDSDSYEIVHTPMVEDQDQTCNHGWLKRISLYDRSEGKLEEERIRKFASRLRFVRDNDKIFGLAAINTMLGDYGDYLGTRTIGGLACDFQHGGASSFVGYLEFDSGSARREPDSQPASGLPVLSKWAKEQIELMHQQRADELEWLMACYAFADLRVDNLSIFRILIQDKGSPHIINRALLLEILNGRGLAVYVQRGSNYIAVGHRQASFDDYPIFIPMRHSNLNSIETDGGKPKYIGSLMYCIAYLSRIAGRPGVAIERRACSAENFVGPMDVVIIRLMDG